jgi:hypothetical protein
MLRGGSKEMEVKGLRDIVLTASTSRLTCHTFIDLAMDFAVERHFSV